MDTLFQPYTLPPVRYEITTAPIHNALVSLSLLTADLRALEVEDWVHTTSAALSDQQRRRNRLVFEALGPALAPTHEYADFPAYLAALADTPADTLRDHVLASVGVAAQLLGDEVAFLAHVNAPDEALWREALALLNDPPTLRQLIVDHLNEMWEQFLAVPWQRRLSQLQGFQLFLQQREFPPATPAI